MTQLYGPAVRCKRFRRSWRYGLALLYPASDWSVCSGPSWISARMRPDSRKSLERASWVTSVRTRRDRSLHRRLILSQTSAGTLAKLGHRQSPPKLRLLIFHAVPLFVPSGRFFVPARECVSAPRARAVKAGRREDVAACAGVSRPRLDGPEHGARIKQIETLLHRS